MCEEDPLPVDRLLHGWLAGWLGAARARARWGYRSEGEGGGGEVGGCGGELNWVFALMARRRHVAAGKQATGVYPAYGNGVGMARIGIRKSG